MPKAWPEALKPSSQARSGPSQAKPAVGLWRAQGPGLEKFQNSPPPQERVRAQARPGQALLAGLGLGLKISEPKPAQAKPKPWLSGQARPWASLDPRGDGVDPRVEGTLVAHTAYLGLKSQQYLSSGQCGGFELQHNGAWSNVPEKMATVPHLTGWEARLNFEKPRQGSGGDQNTPLGRSSDKNGYHLCWAEGYQSKPSSIVGILMCWILRGKDSKFNWSPRACVTCVGSSLVILSITLWEALVDRGNHPYDDRFNGHCSRDTGSNTSQGMCREPPVAIFQLLLDFEPPGAK
ncbi:hypothetical protein C8R47DRAFT_1075596 [Mycena vitilis]|nr:hypothetical protein C8R47DRAFT_1075596 [Mycena vitilis]